MGRYEQVAAAAKAVRHELNEVEALTEYSERGACEICEAVVRVVLEAMAPSVSPECICGHPQLAHEDDVGFCWDCDACAADPACREFVERRREIAEGEVLRLRDALKTLANPNVEEWEASPYVKRMADFARNALQTMPRAAA
jgi:hypothetical protein